MLSTPSRRNDTILIVVYVFLDAATQTEVFPCFFLGCKANARVILAKTVHGPHSSKIVVLFYVLFVLYRSMYYLCVNVYCHRVTTQLQLTNISYIIYDDDSACCVVYRSVGNMSPEMCDVCHRMRITGFAVP